MDKINISCTEYEEQINDTIDLLLDVPWKMAAGFCGATIYA